MASTFVPLLYLVLCCVEEVRSEVLCIDGASLSISGCPGCVTVVRDVVFAVLGHLNYIHYAMKRAVGSFISGHMTWV